MTDFKVEHNNTKHNDLEVLTLVKIQKYYFATKKIKRKAVNSRFLNALDAQQDYLADVNVHALM